MKADDHPHATTTGVGEFGDTLPSMRRISLVVTHVSVGLAAAGCGASAGHDPADASTAWADAADSSSPEVSIPDRWSGNDASTGDDGPSDPSAADRGGDAAESGAGASTPDASYADAPSYVDASVDDLPTILPGIWLIGWMGDLNHFSWVRFDAPNGSGGPADYLPGAGISINFPYWNCSGLGSWAFTQNVHTVNLTFPPACNAPALVLTFDSFAAPPRPYARGATLQAYISEARSGGPLWGFKFGPGQCDAQMTQCANPL